MTSNNLKFYIGSFVAGLLGVSAFIADMPSALQQQIAQPFPESVRGYLAVVFAIAAYASHHYASAAARNALTVPVSVNVSPSAMGMMVAAQSAETNALPISTPSTAAITQKTNP